MNIPAYWQIINEYISIVARLESVFFLISLIMVVLIYFKSYHEKVTVLVWLYSSLIPAFIILFLNYFNSTLLCAIYFAIQCIFVCLYIHSLNKNYKNIVSNTQNPLTKIKGIDNSNYGKQKSLEYVGLFILPFITVNDAVNLYTVFFIFVIVIIIIIRFELYYLNLPILLFFKLQKIESSRRVKMTVITPRDFIFVKEEQYDIRSFIKKLNLYIIIPSSEDK